ncbi:MAG: S4 domain-containing protein, partial [Erysipelotrichaceae bacterium]
MRIGTRKEVKEIIRKGRVKINDSIVKKSDIHLSESDIVMVDDRVIEYLEYE